MDAERLLDLQDEEVTTLKNDGDITPEEATELRKEIDRHRAQLPDAPGRVFVRDDYYY